MYPINTSGWLTNSISPNSVPGDPQTAVSNLLLIRKSLGLFGRTPLNNGMYPWASIPTAWDLSNPHREQQNTFLLDVLSYWTVYVDSSPG